MPTAREQQIARKIRQRSVKLSHERIVGYTGKLLSDGVSYLVPDANVRGNVWVAIDGNQGNVKSVINKKTGADRIARLKVYLDYAPNNGPLEVVDIAPDQDFVPADLLGSFSVPTPVGDLKQDTTPNALIKNLRVRILSGLTVYIEAGYYYIGTVQYYWPGGSLDLSPYVPATIGTKSPVIIGFDESNIAVAYSGNEVMQSLLPVGAPYFSGGDFVATRNAAVGTLAAALFGIGLLYGQVSITNQADFVDLRAEQVNGNSGGGSVDDATSTAVGVLLLDQDVPSGVTHPVALTLAERNADNGLPTVDTDGMLSTMRIPIGGQPHGVVVEADAWVQYASNPLFGGVAADSAQEPSVIIEAGIFKMWYTHDTTLSPTTGSRHMNYAESDDGLTWTQYGSNPVLGGGGSDYSGFAVHSSVYKFDGLYHCYFSDDNNGNILHSTSADGKAWATPIIVIASTQEAWSNGWNNTFVWREGYQWYMLVDGNPVSGGEFETALAYSKDGLTWVFDAAEWLTSLQLDPLGSSGGMGMMNPPKRDGVYHQWYQPSDGVGAVPTSIYHATSINLIDWTILPGPVIPRPVSGYDQTADPSIIEWRGSTYMYYEQVDNATNRFEICVAIYNGTIAQLIDGVETSSTPASGPVWAPISSGNPDMPLILDGDGNIIISRRS